jgi:hypothetical protein
MSPELASVVLLGLGCAANPWGIMIAILLLDARRGRGIVWTYVVAWIGAITVVLTALLAGFGAVLDSGAEATRGASLVQLILGFVLLGFASRRIARARSRSSRAGASSALEQPPRWLVAIENISYVAAFLLGIYSATYPLVIAAAGEITRANPSSAATVALAVVFVILGSSSVVAVAALGTLAPEHSAAFLDRMRAWLTRHSRAVITTILLVFGGFLIARGLSGL